MRKQYNNILLATITTIVSLNSFTLLQAYHSAGAIIYSVTPNKKVLILLGKEQRRTGAYWLNFTGGKEHKDNNDPKETALRETSEETAGIINPGAIINKDSAPYISSSDGNHITYFFKVNYVDPLEIKKEAQKIRRSLRGTGKRSGIEKIDWQWVNADNLLRDAQEINLRQDIRSPGATKLKKDLYYLFAKTIANAPGKKQLKTIISSAQAHQKPSVNNNRKTYRSAGSIFYIVSPTGIVRILLGKEPRESGTYWFDFTGLKAPQDNNDPQETALRAIKEKTAGIITPNWIRNKDNAPFISSPDGKHITYFFRGNLIDAEVIKDVAKATPRPTTKKTDWQWVEAEKLLRDAQEIKRGHDLSSPGATGLKKDLYYLFAKTIADAPGEQQLTTIIKSAKKQAHISPQARPQPTE